MPDEARTPTVLDATLLQEELDHWTSSGLLREERIGGHRCWVLTPTGEAHLARSATIVLEIMQAGNGRVRRK